MNDFRNILQSIYWCSESIHDGVELANFLIEKGIAGKYAEVSSIPTTCRYYKGKPEVLGLIYDIWRIFASKRVVFLELSDDNFRIRPIIYPHLLVHICNAVSSYRPSAHAAAVGKRIGFNVWDGSNAPHDLREWAGIVLKKNKQSGKPVEYIVKRDVDGELIKLSREYLIPYSSLVAKVKRPASKGASIPSLIVNYRR